MGSLADIRALPPFVRLLAATQLAFNIGFFAVLPYLAEHLGGALGMGGWLVGLVLGLRTFSQQGLFVVGGALTDRYGPRPVVLAGCVLRIAGFLWLGYAQQTASVIAAVLCVGFAAALFSPAVESETARQAVRHEQATGHPRARTLAVFSASGQAGAFLGPLLGSLLLLADFRTATFAGALVFVAVLAGHWHWMPRGRPEPAAGDVRGAATSAHRSAAPPRRSDGALRATVRNGPFLLLCLAYSTYLLAYNQLYLALPEEVVRATGSQGALGWLFALSSLLVVCAQLPVTRAVGERMSHRAALCAGLAVVAAGFLTVAALAPFGLTGAAGLVPAAVYVLALTFGQMLAVPAARALVTELVAEERLGFSMGALSSAAGAVVLGGSAATGALIGAGLGPAAVWSALVCVPVLGVAAGRAVRVRDAAGRAC
ncbi:MFS transporter [Streptomyces tubbatahanensis]|uniref:MFS transporter n=1 Tax=Streptomyces tubbatahanensis TaxID=2923272 RepID=A0ABY3Y365_9ACTN|nr:MFS transporter [Streptomyces tubbatahanensis]UNT01066.1 MFS transporter [Streptomyces tubbatahanensis]